MLRAPQSQGHQPCVLDRYILFKLLILGFINLSNDPLAYSGFKGEISQSLADHQKNALHIDSGCNALKRSSEFGGIVAKSRDYWQLRMKIAPSESLRMHGVLWIHQRINGLAPVAGSEFFPLIEEAILYCGISVEKRSFVPPLYQHVGSVQV